MMKKKPTMQNIADNLGVSKNSVHLALNDKPGIGSELRRLIVHEASRLGYGGYAAREVDAKSRCLMAIIPEYLRNDAFFYADVFWAIESEAKKRGLIFVASTVTPQAEASVTPPDLPTGMDIAGILVIGVLSSAYVQNLSSMGFPVLSVDIPYYDLPISCIATANHSGGYMATKYLIDMGHTRIGFIGPIYAAQSVYERWCGFRQAMEFVGLSADPRFNIVGKPGRFELFDTPEQLEGAFDAVENYPTAWFCGGDRIAISVIHLLSKRGLRVPEDHSIIGFDDIPVAKMVMPQLTTMHVPRKRMGRLAVEYLLRMAEKHQDPVHVSLPCSLVERGSVLSNT